MRDLSLNQLNEVRQALHQCITQGLALPEQRVACLPAYIGPPSPSCQGQALVVDAGGTNVRAAWVKLNSRSMAPEIIAGPLSGILPDGRDQPVSATEFFQYQADLMHKLHAPTQLPLGYCFSYPAIVEPGGDARLTHWTKGIQVSGVSGNLVGQALRTAYGQLGPVKVINDTVAALLGGSIFADSQYTQIIGLIVGTGTNMATYLPASSISKLDIAWNGPMAVNLENGNFTPPYLQDLDNRLDDLSDNPGLQRYEKTISGYYLPKLLQHLCPELQLPDDASAREVVTWADKPGHEAASIAARWLLNRSADMVAAGLAAVADHLGEGKLAIQAEGGLFWKASGYSQRVHTTLQQLSCPQHSFTIIRGDQVNLIGAAAAALA